MREIKIVDGKLKCSRCGEIKPVEMFSKGNNKNGHRSYCKQCASAAYYANHDRERQQRKEYYEKNKDKWYEWGKNKRERNPDKIREYMHTYYENHSDIVRARSKKAYENITEECLEKRRQSYHKRRATKHFKDLQIAHEKHRKALERASISTLTEAEWNRTLKLFNGRCAYCGADWKLTRDHIIPLSKGGGYTAENIVPCCISCNSKKNNKDMEQWYLKRDFFDFDRFVKIEMVKGGAFK